MDAPKTLTTKELKKLEKILPDWKPNKPHSKLVREFVFSDFVSALAFCAKIGVHAQLLGHHPEILLKGAVVKITLTTHETKSLTYLDVALAQKIDNFSN